MPSTNWRVPNAPVQMHGQVSGGEAVAAVGRGGGDWRNQLPSGSRHRIVYKIMDTLRRHHPFSGLEGFVHSLDLKRTALLVEENIFTAATSQTDYLRMISLKMLDFETKYQNHSYIRSHATTVERKYGHLMVNSCLSNSASSSRYPLNPGYVPVYRGPTYLPNFQ